MNIFCSDLDNTIIYSYKHNIGEQKRCVEIYQGREISFITSTQYDLLQRLKDEIMIVPTTTRTIEQYDRIDLGIGDFRYALTCNGGVLLENGKENENWYQESLRMVDVSSKVMKRALSLLEEEKRRVFELRYIKDLFIFTKCEEPEQVVEELKGKLDCTLVDVFNNGIKVYVVPKKLNKGNAVRRLKEYLGADEIIAAGDSEFDVSMLKTCSFGLAPADMRMNFDKNDRVQFVPEDTFFGEELLIRIRKYLNQKAKAE